jgi:transposase
VAGDTQRVRRRAQLDLYTGVRWVGMDETSARKGQGYVSRFADLDACRVIFGTEGRSAETAARFAADLVRLRLGPSRLVAGLVDDVAVG